ncbi:MAG: outer membrane lipoprotein-sorting protein [Candidatus Aminicenantes bacterium]|nr:MAG: outer membrane lipoprotein-sorting protein [Candidatus Aminicenantes bacterium]
MKLLFKLAVFTVCIMACFSLIHVYAASERIPDAKRIVEIGQEVIKLDGAEYIANLIIIDSKGRKRIRKVAQISKLFDNGKIEKRLIRFLAPADVKGIGLLSFDYEKKDDDMWFYMPALRKTRRIVSSEKSKNFMGSEFSYGDITPPNIDSFNYKMLGQEEIAGTPCWKIDMVPINDDIADEYGFSKKTCFYGQADYVIRKAVYFDLDGSLHKEMTVKSIKEVDPQKHRYRPMYMIMENKQNGRKSIQEIENVKFNPDVNDEYFTTRYLRRE